LASERCVNAAATATWSFLPPKGSVAGETFKMHTVHIAHLREKLVNKTGGTDLIGTERGIGYRLVETERQARGV
jgi:hypothetical protein